MPERKAPERKTETSKAEQPQSNEGPKQNVSRRGFLLGAGAGVAGLAVGGAGGVLGTKALTPEKPDLPLATVWVGRDYTACTGCKLCQIACSQTKDANHRIWPAIARVQLHDIPPGVEFPTLCYQCAENAKCVDKCPAGALSVDAAKNNAIVVDTKKCTRVTQKSECVACSDACPGAAVTFHPQTREPLICDLCGGDPACVKVCPKGCLSKNGFREAPASVKEIAAKLQAMYVVAKPPPKSSQAGGEMATLDDMISLI